jgi:23S rRNA pseudouridine2604 synthase
MVGHSFYLRDVRAGSALFVACVAALWHVTGSAGAWAQAADIYCGTAPRSCEDSEKARGVAPAPVAFAARLLLGAPPTAAGVICAHGAGRARSACLPLAVAPLVHWQMSYGRSGRGARGPEQGDSRAGGAGWGNFLPSGPDGGNSEGAERRGERRESEGTPRQARGARRFAGSHRVGEVYTGGGRDYAVGYEAGSDRGEATRGRMGRGGGHAGEREDGHHGRSSGDVWPRVGGNGGERAEGARRHEARLAPGERFRVVNVAPSYGSQNRRKPPAVGSPRATRGTEEDAGVRINKCFKDFTSRREADQLVQEGRVTVNGVVAAMGARVKRGDEVRLDGRPVDWEYLAVVDNSVQAEVQFRYIKYWKPKGVVCTTDQRVRNNIVDAVGYPERVFPVGRLDKDSTGLILLTSDGRLPNAVLRSGQRHDKRYLVTVDREIEERDVATLAEGVVISTPVQRDRVDRIVTARTLPCRIKKVDRRNVEIVLQEGRNRQIRRMMDAVGYEVVALHRVGVMGLTLKGLGEGQWRPCSEDEMEIIRNCLEGADASTSVGQGGVRAELVDCESEED